MREGSASADPPADASRRTWLALERTWLAWWRTGLAATALALAVGRLLPDVSSGPHWPYIALGLGYGVLAIAILVISTLRQRRATAALRRGGFSELPWSLVLALSVSAVSLGIATLVVIAVDL